MDKAGFPRALVIGPADQLPKTVRAQYDLRPMEEYQGDIEPFEKVFITAITQTQLADIALGRGSQPVTCALMCRSWWRKTSLADGVSTAPFRRRISPSPLRQRSRARGRAGGQRQPRPPGPGPGRPAGGLRHCGHHRHGVAGANGDAENLGLSHLPCNGKVLPGKGLRR